MLTEGWDANTVTHVLGVRAFGTQLLCEQVIGRALRRQSYDLNEEGLFNVEYADVLGIPFDFTAKPVVAPPQPPRETIQVKAVRPERDALEIRFPRVEGYRVELPEERLTAEFNDDSVLELTPDLVGPSITQQRGHHRRGASTSTLDAHGRPAPLDAALPPHPAPALHEVARPRRGAASSTSSASSSASPSSGSTTTWSARAAPTRRSSCTRSWPTWPASGSPPASRARSSASSPIKAVLDPYNPTGSTTHVNFNTSKTDRWETDPRRCHVNWVILDSDWEAEFCRVAEAHPRVRAYVKNHNLGLRSALPLRLRDAHVPARLHRAGRRRPRRRTTCCTWWSRSRATGARTPRRRRPRWRPTGCPASTTSARYGRWAFAEFTEVYQIESDFEAKVEAEFDEMIESRRRRADDGRER